MTLFDLEMLADEYRPDPEQEFKLRACALPLALLLAYWFHRSPAGHFLQRTFLTMMVHEAGHAVTAWLCGYAAVPSLWRTWVAQTRGPLTPILVLLAGAFCVAWGARRTSRVLLFIGITLLVVQLWGSVVLSRESAGALIVFGGDGGALVLGAVLMGCFFFGREASLYRGGLRWGFLVIGAAAFVDTLATWWQARTDPDVIPFGEIEGVGLSDPSKLSELYGWSTGLMVRRYVALGVCCFIALAAVWLWGTWSARRARGR